MYDVTDLFPGLLEAEAVGPPQAPPPDEGQLVLFSPQPPDGRLDPLADGPLAGWTWRPDVNGQLGLEAPDLPEEARWWARWRWEDLPTP